MAITEQTQRRILGAAKALFVERKTVSLADLTDYLRSVSNIQVEPADVEESLSRLFERQGANLPAVELHQAMLFRRAALTYWMAQYAILVVEGNHISEPADGETRGHVYLFFGVAGDEPQSGKFLGAARRPTDILEYLKSQGIEVGGWHPLDKEQWKGFIPHTSESIDELIKSFGKSLYTKSLGITFAL